MRERPVGDTGEMKKGGEGSLRDKIVNTSGNQKRGERKLFGGRKFERSPSKQRRRAEMKKGGPLWSERAEKTGEERNFDAPREELRRRNRTTASGAFHEGTRDILPGLDRRGAEEKEKPPGGRRN